MIKNNTALRIDDPDVVQFATTLATELTQNNLPLFSKDKNKALRIDSNKKIENSGVNFTPAKTPKNPTDYSRFDFDGAGFNGKTPIPGTNLFTTAPPRITEKELDKFLLRTVFDPTFPIKNIISVVNTVNNLNPDQGLKPTSREPKSDCLDYMLQNRGTERFKIEVCSPSQEELKKLLSKQGHLIGFNRPIKCVLKITDKQNPADTRKVELGLFPTSDGHPTDFTNCVFGSDLSLLYDFYKKSLRNPTLVHCKASAGRTGYEIFMFLIIQYFDEIFDKHLFCDLEEEMGPEDCEAFLQKILEETRQKLIALTEYLRIWFPGFIDTKRQWEGAIRNALLFCLSLKDNKNIFHPKMTTILNLPLVKTNHSLQKHNQLPLPQFPSPQQILLEDPLTRKLITLTKYLNLSIRFPDFTDTNEQRKGAIQNATFFYLLLIIKK